MEEFSKKNIRRKRRTIFQEKEDKGCFFEST